MNNNSNSWGRIRSVMQEAARDWMYDPNVMFVDYGWRERGGKLVQDENCIRVHVIEKIAPGPNLEAAAQSGKTRGQIPKTISGIPVDIQRRSYGLHPGWWSNFWWLPKPANSRFSRNSPMRGGISVSNANLRGSGTLGGLVLDRRSGDKMILSNWHVLVGRWYARIGEPIFQPGRGDGGSHLDTVAKLTRHAMDNNLDAAVAELTDDRELINDLLDLGPVNGVAWAQLGMKVTKSGRTTEVTEGFVTGVEGTIKLSYGGVKRLVRNVMTITPRGGPNISKGGDSGSFWLDVKTMNAVGLHFAGSDYPDHALAIDMHPILDALKVTLP